jgi:hypothetical protein
MEAVTENKITTDWPERVTHGWILTKSGQQFFPLAPEPEKIVIEDIAHALSNICRFTGHVRQFYSVAQHSCHVAQLVRPQFQLWALLHDASEAYLCDLAAPVKNQLPGYKLAEEAVMRAVAIRFGLRWPMPPEVKNADMRMFYRERENLMPYHGACEPSPFPPAPLEPMTPAEAKIIFLDGFRRFYATAQLHS